MSWQAMLGERLINETGAEILIGSDTTPIHAVWNNAEPGRARLFLTPEMYDQPSYFAMVPASVRDNPKMKNGAEVYNIRTGFRGVIRHIDDSAIATGGTTIVLLVVETAR